jgi:DNA polymerase elongation subunit (family B)
MVLLQPCDWIEHDERGKYVVDVYGRTEETSAMVRIEGFKPYLYVLPGSQTVAELKKRLAAEKVTQSIVTEHIKYDAWAGYQGYESVKVWKIEVDSLFDWRAACRISKAMFPRVYGTNLPPFLRLFHDRTIGPASPILFVPSKKTELGWNTQARDVTGDPSKTVPLKVAAYDIECMSGSGQFPIAIKDWKMIGERFNEDMANESLDPEMSISDILIRRLKLEGMVIPATFKDKILKPFLTPTIVEMLEGGEGEEVADRLGKRLGISIGDPVIQIGITVRWSTDMLTNVKRRVFVLGGVTGSSEYVSCETEGDVIEAFLAFLEEEDPDILCGYNTYGFDDKYLHDRATLHGLGKAKFGRVAAWGDPLEHKVFELASGKYNVNFIKMPGRLTIDLLLNIRREHNLDSYTLDNVAASFLRDKVARAEGNTIVTKTTRGLSVGNYVRFDIVGNTINPYREGQKFKVVSMGPKQFCIEGEEGLFADLTADEIAHLEWSFTKDDIHPADIFRMHEGSDADRGTIAKYCVQDCDLVLTLMAKLDTLTNARGMADVCFVPLQYLFLRGQGIKIFSRVTYEASKRDQIIATQESHEGDSSYEGAIVISPKIGMYLETPVAVLDFNSLYPSSMIGENLSPDTLICMKTYDANGRLVSLEGMSNVSGLSYNEVSYDLKQGAEVTGKVVCLYVRPTEGNELSYGLIPRSLEIMLKMRKEARRRMEDPGLDDAQKAVYNGLQLAYKVVANSIYGQMGSRTSPIRKICVAACTTAVGRRQLLFAKSTVETEYGADVVYGDTDSIFVKFPGKDLQGAIEAGQAAAKLITSRCRHKAFVIGYEKTFYPFILFCRKRYVGMKYEEDPSPTACKRASMGIVLKRRDNAPIVKDVFGGALDRLLLEKDVNIAAAFVKSMLTRVVRGEFPLEKFAITKQLRDDYKDPTRIAHRVLADRMTARDPGNAPNVGDRLKFVYIQAPDKKLQGDKIEHIEYVREKKLLVDTTHYITNQIQNPVAQLFALCIDEMEGYREPRPSYRELYDEYLEQLDGNEEEATLKVLAHKEKHLNKLLFLEAPYLANVVRMTTRGPIDKFFRK